MKVDVKIAGASYSEVPAVLLPLKDGGRARFCEVSDTTAEARDVAQGKRFYNSEGDLIVGTSTGSGTTTDTRKRITVVQKPNQVITVTNEPAELSHIVDDNGNEIYMTEYQSRIKLAVQALEDYTAGNITVGGVEMGQEATVDITDGMLVSATDASKIQHPYLAMLVFYLNVNALVIFWDVLLFHKIRISPRLTSYMYPAKIFC